MSERLYRSRDDRMLAGVAGGLAEMWDADPSLVRIVWALLVFLTGGFALLVYIVMAIVVPEGDAPSWSANAAAPGTPDAAHAADTRRAAREAREARRAERRAARGERGNPAGILIGALLIVVGGAFLVREWLPAFDFDFLWPLTLVALGIVVLVIGFSRGSGGGGTGS